jgi:Bacterial transcriptional activator domain
VRRLKGVIRGGGSDRLREALALWPSRSLADFKYEPFALGEIARLEQERLAALEDRIDADLAVGRHAALIGELEALVREHPFRERLHAQLMRAFYRSGRQSDALDHHKQTRRTTVGELGIEPGPELQQLERAILTQDPALGGRSAYCFPPSESSPACRYPIAPIGSPSVEFAHAAAGAGLWGSS